GDTGGTDMQQAGTRDRRDGGYEVRRQGGLQPRRGDHRHTKVLGQELLPGPPADGALRRQVGAIPDRSRGFAWDPHVNDRTALASGLQICAKELVHPIHPRASNIRDQSSRSVERKLHEAARYLPSVDRLKPEPSRGWHHRQSNQLLSCLEEQVMELGGAQYGPRQT